MKSFKVFLIALAIALALVNMHHATASNEAELLVDAHKNVAKTVPPQLSSHREAMSRFLAAQMKPRPAMTCDKNPRVCWVKGSSAGPDCCKKQCVDVLKDRLNCGKCGRKCKYSEMCCMGVCVNPSYNHMHCGQCNHRCNKGRTCVYGMCSYA